MLDEVALVPDIFDQGAYSIGHPEFVQSCLDFLRRPLLDEVLVRDLRGGEWSTFCSSQAGSWHPRAKELLRKLRSQNRLHLAPPASPAAPTSPADWCAEALGSHAASALTGIISANATKRAFAALPEVASIEALGTTPWWTGRSTSVRLARTTTSYLNVLTRILRQANSLMFIDRNLDPSKGSYREFVQLLQPLASRNPPVRIELHRVCYDDPQDRRDLGSTHWRTRFEPLRLATARLGLEIDIFIWDDHHDRYLITDVVGLNLPNGFDISNVGTTLTTWNRLGRRERDDIQCEFDPAARRHVLHHTFRL